MLNKLVTVIFLASCVITGFAQNSQPRPYLYVDEFTSSGGFRTSDIEAIRASVVSALSASGRFDMLNTSSQEVVMGSDNNYILKGDLLSFTMDRKSVNGETAYTYGLKYSITLVDAGNQTDIYSHTYSYGDASESFLGGLGIISYTSEQEALKALHNKVKKDIRRMIIEQLPLEGEIIGEDIVVKGNKLEYCYITIGSGLGVKVGDVFSVLSPQIRAGRTVYTPIGKLKVKETFDDDPSLSYCSVIDNAKEVYEALEEYFDAISRNENAKPLKVRATVAFKDKI